MHRLDKILNQAAVLPVMVIERRADAVPLARALVAGGLPVMEVTLRSDVALAAIRQIALEVPEAIVGAGTVLHPDDLQRVADAGARFAVSPGATEALYAAAERTAIPWLPAISTASELMRGLEHGHELFKFFPAEAAGGVTALKALAGPFPRARFCPSGGIEAASAPRYLALPNVLAVGGSWMLPKRAIDAGDWAAIESEARAAVALRAG